jgi:ankyrin repeat protein
LAAKEVRNWLPDSCKELSDVLDIARVHAIHGEGLAIAVERARQARRANKASFARRIDAVDDGLAAIRRGDFEAFVYAAEVLLPHHLSMLNMASFYSCHNDRSLLHYAAIYNDLPAARWLLQHGASPSPKSKDSDGYDLCSTYWTPLHHAACTGNAGMCRLLLSAGADVEAQIARGDVDHFLNSSSLQKEFDCDRGEAERLVGLEPSTKRFSAGSRPVDIAESMGHVAVVEILQPFVLTLHMGEVGPHGLVDVAVTNLGGDEVASITADLNNRVESLRILISETIEEWASCLFMLPNGNVLSDDAARLGDVLEGAAIVGDDGGTPV